MSKLTSLESRLSFGKYKGMTVKEVLEKACDSNYIIWLMEKTERTAFPKEVENYIYMDNADHNMCKSFSNYEDHIKKLK